MVVGHGSSSPVFTISLPQLVTILDYSPSSLRIAPSAISHDGHASITVTGSFPPGGTPRASFSSTRLPSLRNSSCLFTSPSTSRTLTLAATGHNVSNATISFVCGPLLPGDSGPPMSSWNVAMLLADGRQSAELSIDSYCPAGSFVESTSAASPLKCSRCPPQRSSSTRDNAAGIQSCVCAPNYYGTFGDGCTACPKNVEGFN